MAKPKSKPTQKRLVIEVVGDVEPGCFKMYGANNYAPHELCDIQAMISKAFGKIRDERIEEEKCST